jgi:DNA-binding transcriptional LysR family regulator
MNLSIRDLEACLAVADLRNFSRAAERCHLSQSAFSTRVSQVEKLLGARLFDRTTRAVELTNEGVLFIESARRLVGDFTEFVDDFRSHTSKRKGRVAIAALPSISSAWLPAVFADFQSRHPGITLTLHDVVSDACIAKLRDGSVDFAVASHPADGEDMEANQLSEDNFYLVCQRGHSLASKAGLKARDLASHPFISLSRDSSVRQALERAIGAANMHSVMQLEHMATVAGMVQAGLGVTVVPELTLFQFTRPGLVVRPLKISGLSRSIYVVRRKGRTLSVAAQALYEHMMAERTKIHAYLRMQLGAAAV